MVSCFFCQNLLSDFIEEILPATRHQELKDHLEGCKDCSHLHQNLKDTVGLLHKLPVSEINPDLRDQLLEASKSALRPWRSRAKISRWAMGLTTPVLAAGLFLYLFPEYFPWKDLLTNQDEESQYVRFFPLMHDANEIVDEQTSWLHGRDLRGGSLWEEGGLSSDEFEKAFQPSRPRDVAP
ncbi:MAG: zf-HC2 domain-containing protein [Deltaproteobacteria bacterium]|nr:zf-HC2 domain-containing protein [Deltaproteobacteria bacterium]MBI3293912.1 zf-HC2 domain-containing protein [Deltaproteobacteria bacterium]